MGDAFSGYVVKLPGPAYRQAGIPSGQDGVLAGQVGTRRAHETIRREGDKK
jgi:hypothetical protein